MVGRGHDKTTAEHGKRDCYFFLVKIAPHFEFSQDWYRKGDVAALVGGYYYALAGLVFDHPELERCMKHCVHCGIRFVTHPCNHKRDDLRCPFGCREAHEKREKARACAEYRATSQGREYKEKLNEQRAYAKSSPEEAETAETTADTAELTISEPMMQHVRMVTSLIERRRVSRDEIFEILFQKVRQGSLHRELKADRLVRHLHANVPDG